jgi:hypothetical protein
VSFLRIALFKLTYVLAFIYDFHLYYFQKVLDFKVEQSPYLDFLGVLKAFIRYYPRAASFSKNRVHCGTFHADPKLAPENLFFYLAKNPMKYGFNCLKFNGQLSCLFLVSNCKFFSTDDKGEDSQHRFTIIIYPSTETVSQGPTSLNYFLLSVQVGTCSPYYTIFERKWNSEAIGGNDPENHPLEEYICENFTLSNLINYAVKRLSVAVEQV